MAMTRKRYAFWIELEQQRALDYIRIRDGVLPSEQIRRALDDWFRKNGVKAERESLVRTERKRASTRKRS
jgi:hypothetical protein